jgi:hypothetical protein
MHQVSKILFCHETLHISGIFCAHHQELSAVHVAIVMFHAWNIQIATCTADNSWWWAQKVPETRRVSWQNKILDTWSILLVIYKKAMSVSTFKGISPFFVHRFILYSQLHTQSPYAKVAWPWTDLSLSLNTQTLPDTFPSWSVRPPYIKHGFLSLNSCTHKKSHCVH